MDNFCGCCSGIIRNLGVGIKKIGTVAFARRPLFCPPKQANQQSPDLFEPETSSV
jgi:hypothetical protein